MFDHPLSLATRASITLTSLVFVVFALRTIFRGSRGAAFVLAGAWLVAAAFAHVQVLTDTLTRTFPLGGVAIAAAVASLFSAPLRRAFDEVSDADMRVLLSFRAIYGALLFAAAAIGHLPTDFALTAGLGDLLVGWLAIAMPLEKRWARLVVHGLGLADMLMVLFSAMTIVRPWSAAHANATTIMTLPWLAVPLMFAINAHGLRKAFGSEAVVDGSEPARGVRSALP
jgi:hypothetical protein